MVEPTRSCSQDQVCWPFSFKSKIKKPNSFISGLREFLLLEYATCLMSHCSLWQLGAVYLDHCPTQGRQRLEALLSRIAPDNERKANKVCFPSLVELSLIFH